MIPRIEIMPEKRLAGKKLAMSFSNDKTFQLWQSFMPVRRKITNAVGTDLFSMQVYDRPPDAKDFTKETEFEKWAVTEVASFEFIPDEMETYTLPRGLYAVFLHKGAASTGPETFRYIFQTWLPASEYSLDHRPHFEILGERYKNNDPDSEEEIWIPIKPRK